MRSLLMWELSALLLVVLQASCAGKQAPVFSVAAPAAGQDLQATAAAEATVIVQQAEATAIMMKAQAQAEALIAEANDPLNVGKTDSQATWITPTAAKSSSPTTIAMQKPGTPTATDEQVVQVMGVGFAADGGFIIIRFKAPPDEADRWWQGSIFLTDEGTGTEYNEIPVMPKIGPLISKPQIYGQVGYAMLVNPPPGLPSGALVTVVLGNHKFEHIKVE